MKSHDSFRLVEPYMYFHLPGDTPAEDLLNETPRSAPCRFVFLPSVNGLQMLSQIRYRQTDTRGRPGSYFAHVLFREQKGNGTPWSAADCLGLWGAAAWAI